MDHLNRGITYIKLDLNHIKLFVFVDGSFTNNKDFSSQIGYEIFIINKTLYKDNLFEITRNLIHFSSTKCKRVTQSILISEIYGIVGGIDIVIIIYITIKMIIDQLGYLIALIIVYIDLYLLYKCLVKLGTTREKRLIINVMAI